LIFSQNKNIEAIKDLLIKSGADAAGLTGSGSALFGIFGDRRAARKCRDIINFRTDTEFCDIFDFLS
jgi:4-diphosphocytidyl-2C-methyl-D-erythritol kinase